MRVSSEENYVHFYLDEHEDEQQLLRAIAEASYELASPSGLSILDYRENDRLSRADAEGCILQVPRRHDSCVLEMDFVKGRQCKTVVLKQADGNLALLKPYFRRFRGEPEPLLQKVALLLSNA